MASSLLGCPVTVAVELVRRPRGSLAGPEEAVKIGERALLVQALRRPVCSRSPRPPPLREFLFRPRHWRLPRCLEIDRYLDVVSNEKSALIESLVPADAIIFAIQRRSHHEGDARTPVSVWDDAAGLDREHDPLRDPVQSELANNSINVRFGGRQDRHASRVRCAA